MTTVSSQNSNTPVSDSTATKGTNFSSDLAPSLATVLSKLSGKKISQDQLTNMKFSEEILYAANVLEQLKKTSSQLAKTFVEELKTRYDRRITRNDTQPIAKAIHDILYTGAKDHYITQNQYDKIVSTALGRAQIDRSKSAVGNRVNSGGLKKAQLTVDTNPDATQKQVASFEKSITKLAFQTPSATRAQTARLKKIFDSVSTTSTGTTTTGTTGTGTTTTTKGTDEDSKKTVEPDPTRESSPHHFDYRYKSDRDGKTLIRLPTNFGQDIKSVEIKDSSGNVLEVQSEREIGTDKRIYIRFSKSGTDYGSSFTININFQNGSELPIKIEKSEQNFSRGYAG